jgi:hypothetical protein
VFNSTIDQLPSPHAPRGRTQLRRSPSGSAGADTKGHEENVYTWLADMLIFGPDDWQHMLLCRK